MDPTQELSPEILAALAAADRSLGWNCRSPAVKRFEIGRCLLYVVPYRRWAFRRQEEQAAGSRRGRP